MGRPWPTRPTNKGPACNFTFLLIMMLYLHHGGAACAISRGRKKGAAREGECGRRASTVMSLLFNHKAEPALSPKVHVFSEENNGFGGL